jgi:hypothetical protein
MLLAEVEADRHTGEIAADTMAPLLLILTAHSSHPTDSSPRQHMVLINLHRQRIRRSSNGIRSTVNHMALNPTLTLR